MPPAAYAKLSTADEDEGDTAGVLPPGWRDRSPESGASCFQLLSFGWINPLFAKAQGGKLEPEDLPAAAEREKSDALLRSFKREWEAQDAAQTAPRRLGWTLIKLIRKVWAKSISLKVTADMLKLLTPVPGLTVPNCGNGYTWRVAAAPDRQSGCYPSPNDHSDRLGCSPRQLNGFAGKPASIGAFTPPPLSSSSRALSRPAGLAGRC